MGVRGAIRLKEAAGVLAAAGAYFFGTGLNGFAPLLWFAPIPVLTLAYHSSGRRSATMAFVAYAVGGLNIAPYLTRLAPPAVVVAALIVPALAYTLAVLAQRYALLHFRHWGCIFAFPAAWTSYEFLLSLVSPDGTALNLAYSQGGVLPLVQLAALTGIWGISFVVTLFPASVAAAWHWRRERRLALTAIGVPVCLVLAAWTYGWTRLNLVGSHPQSTLRVGAAATDETVGQFNTSRREKALPILRAYARRVEELARHGARVVVLPEKLVGVTPNYEEEALQILRDSSRRQQVTVIAGLNRVGRVPSRNTAFVFGPDGRLLIEYDKAFLLPGFESGYDRGLSPGLFSVLGATAGGVVTISDHLGRILAERVSSESADVLLCGEVPLGPGHTLYSLAGDWLGATSVVMILSLLVTVARRARRPVMAAERTDSPAQGQ